MEIETPESQLAATLSLDDETVRLAVFIVWSDNWRSYWTDLPTKFHVVEGAD